MGEYESLTELLVWIVSGGGAMILAGYVVAYFLENLKFWHGLPREIKIVVPIILAALLGSFAESLLALELLTQIPPTIKSLILVLINWFAGQRAYKGIKDGIYAASARR